MVDDLDGAVRAHADLVAASSFVAVLIRGEESAFRVGIPDDRAACAAVHEVAALHVANPDVVVVPHGADAGFALDAGVVALFSHDHIGDTERSRNDLRGDIGAALGGVQVTIKVGLELLRTLEAVEERKAQNHRVWLLAQEGELLDGGVDVRRHIHRVEVCLSVGGASRRRREGGRVQERVSGLDLVIQHQLVHAEFRRYHFRIKEVAHLFANDIIDALLVAVFGSLIVVPLEDLIGLVVGAGSAALLAFALEEFAFADGEFRVATHFALAAVDRQKHGSDVVFFLMDGLHEESADVLPWNGICGIVSHIGLSI